MTLCAVLSLTYTTYPSASDVLSYVQLTVMLVADTLTTVTLEGDDDGAVKMHKLNYDSYNLPFTVIIDSLDVLPLLA